MTPEEELAGLIREALLSHIALSDVMMDSVEHEALAREILSSGFVERMRRSPMQWRDDPLRDMFVIWSREHHAYWRPGSAGYCAELFGAGLYTQAEAVEICSNAEKQNVMSDARGAFDQLMQAISREALLSVAFQHFRQAAEQARLAAYAECAGIADKSEDHIAKVYDLLYRLRETLRLRLEPESEDLREEYRMANDALYGLGGRVNAGGAIRAAANQEKQG